MSSDPNIFDCFLDSHEMFVLYQKIGTVYKNKRDLANERLRGKAFSNTLLLLLNTAMIILREGEYFKTTNYQTCDAFLDALIASIKTQYPDEVSSIINCNKHYDEEKNLFFIYINDIPLRYMGLAMLMEQKGEFERIKNRVYFIGIKNYRHHIKRKSQITIEELQKRLQRNIELGEQAERFAWEYEGNRLKQCGINKEPLRVSDIDVSAGYDMVSYESSLSNSFDRFIEVKAVSNIGFFWSRNEYEVAKLKADKYYLYLVEIKRLEEPDYKPEIINNPAEVVMESSEWFVEAETFQIKRI